MTRWHGSMIGIGFLLGIPFPSALRSLERVSPPVSADTLGAATRNRTVSINDLTDASRVDPLTGTAALNGGLGLPFGDGLRAAGGRNRKSTETGSDSARRTSAWFR